jgi:hypothetical protein
MFNVWGKGRVCTIGLVTVCAMSALLYGLGMITAEAEDLPVSIDGITLDKILTSSRSALFNCYLFLLKAEQNPDCC